MVELDPSYLAAGLVMGLAVGGGLYARQSKEKSDLAVQAENNCASRFEEDRSLGGFGSFAVDRWDKDGRIVVEVGFDKIDSSYKSRLCVFNPKTSRMTAPTNFGRGRWEKRDKPIRRYPFF
ncbi:hypothetical protein NIT7645_02268 [Phaeobacter italicus]|nr:hypothetical protein NIT7645_02268 [Phaeobacter italicus]SFH68102.1 hypothetical protein SAMN04488019_1306 [Phaeobacter italicus]